MIKRLLNAADELLDKTIVLSYTNLGYHLRERRWSETAAELDGKVCLVTGANAGLGFEIAQTLAARGATVHMLCRSRERGELARQEIVTATENPNVTLHIVDLSQQASIQQFADSFGDQPLHVLINNAGVLLNERQLSADGIEMTFATNVLGYFLLTERLYPCLAATPGARVINVTSGGMYAARLHLDDLQWEKRPYNGTNAYAETKRAEMILTRLWAQTWADDNIAVHAVHPGWAATPGVATSLPRFNQVTGPFLRTAAQGADTILWLAGLPDLDQFPNGKLWFDRQIRPEHKRGVKRNSAAEIDAFWQICHELTATK